jgi:hypothetical protein
VRVEYECIGGIAVKRRGYKYFGNNPYSVAVSIIIVRFGSRGRCGCGWRYAQAGESQVIVGASGRKHIGAARVWARRPPMTTGGV